MTVFILRFIRRLGAGVLWVPVCFCFSLADAEDVVVMKDSKIIKGVVTSVDADGFFLKDDKGTFKHPHNRVARVTLDLPAAFDQAMKAFAEGKYSEAAKGLKPFVDKYAGVGDDRVATALISLADACVEQGDVAGARPLYEKFRKLYASQQDRAEVGMAKIAVLERKYDEALKLLEPSIALAAKTQSPTPAQERGFCEAFYLRGVCLEEQKKYSEALESYLTAAVIYSGYSQMAAKAKQQADRLRQEHNKSPGTPTVYVP